MAYYYVIRDHGVHVTSGLYWFDVDFYASAKAFEEGQAPVLNEDFVMALDLPEEGGESPVAQIVANIERHAVRAESANRRGFRKDVGVQLGVKTDAEMARDGDREVLDVHGITSHADVRALVVSRSAVSRDRT